MGGSTNFLRDTRRDILRAVREQSMDRSRAMDEYVEALVGVESLKAQAERAAAKADGLRRAARDAGNSASELRSAERIVREQWKGIAAQDTDAERSDAAAEDQNMDAAEPSDNDGDYLPAEDASPTDGSGQQ